MKNVKKLLVLSIGIIFSSCTNNSKSIYKVDMDQQFVWQDNPPSNLIICNDAITGRFVCNLNSINPYSSTFNMKSENLLRRDFTEIVVSGYIKVLSKGAKPMFCLELKDSTNNCIEYLSEAFSDERVNEWVYCEYTVPLDEKDRLNKTFLYRIYGLNSAKETTLLDDLCVEFK
jgi:hypothetical protein